MTSVAYGPLPHRYYPNLTTYYLGDVKEIVDEAIEEGDDLPHSDAYPLNGQANDLCPCSNGIFPFLLRVHVVYMARNR